MIVTHVSTYEQNQNSARRETKITTHIFTSHQSGYTQTIMTNGCLSTRVAPNWPKTYRSLSWIINRKSDQELVYIEHQSVWISVWLLLGLINMFRGRSMCGLGKIGTLYCPQFKSSQEKKIQEKPNFFLMDGNCNLL